MSRKWFVALLCAVSCAGVWAQEQEKTQTTGSVAGNVIYADTKVPGRLAQVVLVRLAEPDKSGAKKEQKVKPCGLGCLTTAGLEGNFLLESVPVGRYLVSVAQTGVVPALARLDLEALNLIPLAEADETKLKDALPYLTLVTVEAGKTARVTVNLRHGGSISGAVSYDDGAPAVGIRVHLLRKTEAGHYLEANLMSLGSAASNATLLGFNTDDQGRFRIAGLAPGSYALRAEVPLGMLKNFASTLKNVLAVSLSGDGKKSKASLENLGSSMGAGLSVYSGNVFSKKDLKPVELGENEQYGAADLVIPLSGMHTVTARVVDGATGKGVEIAQVELLDTEGKERLREEYVDDDGSCSFEYVPEGNYVLRVVNAMEVKEESKKSAPYGSAEMKIEVAGDLDNLVLSVSKKKN